MKTLSKVENFELWKVDRRASFEPQLKHWLEIFALKHRTKPSRIVWNPGNYRKADSDSAPEVDETVPKGYVKMVVR